MEREKLVQARTRKHWTQHEVAEQIGVDYNTVYRWERGLTTPRGYNLRRLCEIYEASASELGLDGEDETVEDRGVSSSVREEAHVFLGSDLTESNHLSFSFLSSIQHISPSETLEHLSHMLATACTTLTLSPYAFLHAEKRERLLNSVQKPSYLDTTVLADLSEITGRYWKLSANISLQLLQGILGHFQTITQLLNTTQPTSFSQELFSLSSEAAQLLGKTLFDLRDYSLSFSYYTFALKAALEAHNHDLWATALGRMSLLLLSNNQPQQALSLLREIQNCTAKKHKSANLVCSDRSRSLFIYQ